MHRRAPFLLASVLFAISLVVFLVQAPWRARFPGNYPLVAAPIGGAWSLAPGSASVRVDGTSRSGRLIVFAYNQRGEMLGILKPVVDGVVTVNRGDYADFRLPVHGREVGQPVLLKAMDHYLEREDMLDHLAAARQAGRSFGLQRCLFPICNRCLDGCRTVVTTGRYPLTMQLQPGGFVHPVFEKGKCPRCGKCFTWCPSGSLVELRRG